MNAEKKMDDAKVTTLNHTLTSVENELMGRALDRRDDELDHTLDCINRGSEAGVIDIQCGGSGEEKEGEKGEPGEEGKPEEEVADE